MDGGKGGEALGVFFFFSFFFLRPGNVLLSSLFVVCNFWSAPATQAMGRRGEFCFFAWLAGRHVHAFFGGRGIGIDMVFLVTLSLLITLCVVRVRQCFCTVLLRFFSFVLLSE